MNDHGETRAKARAVLDPLFTERGFRAQDGAAGHGSSGAFAMWSYEGDGRRAVLETRDRSPLQIWYELDDPGCRVGHTHYMEAATEERVDRPWEGTAVELAETLRGELEVHGADFLAGSGETLRRVARELDERPTGFAALTDAEDRIRRL